MLKCAVGIISNSNNQILIAERQGSKMGAGLWEFPGGKIEHNETAIEALIRELKEEIGIVPIDYHEFISYQFDYSTHSVLLETFLVNRFEGQAKGAEGQKILWVDKQRLKNFPFLAANEKIIDLINK